MRIAILVKQIPVFEEMELGPDGRLVRNAVELEMSAFCRRAVSAGVALAKEREGSTTTVFTLGPPSALDVLREAVGWGVDRAVLLTDERFAGSDTVATTEALVAALAAEGPFDLVLVGRNSLDAETGQVGPGVAELLGWDFLPCVKVLALDGETVNVTCEEDDGESKRTATLPLVIATAERLTEPAKVSPDRWPDVGDARFTVVDATTLGAGPWGAAASPTTVGEIRVYSADREHVVLSGAPEESTEQAVEILERRGAFAPSQGEGTEYGTVEPETNGARTIGVVIEPERPELARELLGEANALAVAVDAKVVAITIGDFDVERLASFGADEVVAFDGVAIKERDVADAIADLEASRPDWALLFGSTTWGREVASRISARLSLGLTGDALEFGIDQPDGRPVLVAWKSALGGQLLAAIRSATEPQMATVRPGALPLRRPRIATPIPVRTNRVDAVGNVSVQSSRRNDDVEELERATRVVGVGVGVAPEEYDDIEAFAKTLGATLGTTRRVTDKGWMPHSRQIGITGRSIRPHLYVAIGISGKFNHVVGVRAAGTILAVNSDPDAPIFGYCDVGIVGDWHEIVPLLDKAIAARA